MRSSPPVKPGTQNTPLTPRYQLCPVPCPALLAAPRPLSSHSGAEAATTLGAGESDRAGLRALPRSPSSGADRAPVTSDTHVPSSVLILPSWAKGHDSAATREPRAALEPLAGVRASLGGTQNHLRAPHCGQKVFGAALGDSDVAGAPGEN